MKNSNSKNVVVKASNKRAPLSKEKKAAALIKRRATLAAKKEAASEAAKKEAAKKEAASLAASKLTTSPATLERYGRGAATYYAPIEGDYRATIAASFARKSGLVYGRILDAIDSGAAVSNLALADYFNEKGRAPLTLKNKEYSSGAKGRLSYIEGYLSDLLNRAYSPTKYAPKENRRVIKVVDAASGADIA